MRKMLVVLGVLALFSLTLTPAYALEGSTWGRIKATFSENPVEATDGIELLTYQAFPHALAKPGVVRPVSEFVRADRGGLIKLDVGWAKMKLSIEPGALSEDMSVTLSVEQIDGIPWFVVAGSIHQTCDPPAELEIEADVLLAGTDLGTFTLVHQVEETDPWDLVPSEIELDVDEEEKIAELEIKAYLPEFSRYALAASR